MSSESLAAKRKVLPKAWLWAKLGEMITPADERFTPTPNSKDIFVGLEHIEGHTGRLLGYGKASETRSTKTKFSRGDLLYGKLRPYLNKVCIPDFDGVCSTDILVFKKTPVVNTKYIGFLLSGSDFVRYASQNMKGVQHPRVSFQTIADYLIPIAPLSEQQRIVSKIEELFTKLDVGIEALKKVKELLKQYRDSLLKGAFEGRITESWRNERQDQLEPAQELLERIQSQLKEKSKTIPNELSKNTGAEAREFGIDFSQLPDKWHKTTIDEISIVVRGASPRPAGNPKYYGGKIPWITVGSITRDNSPYLMSVSEFLTQEGREKSRYVEAETLMLTNSGATLGVPKITKIGGCFNDGSVALLYIDYPLKMFLYYFLSRITRHLRQINQGAAQPNLNTGIVKSIAIPLPPEEEQKEIIKQIQKQLSVIDSIGETIMIGIRQAAALRRLILKKAFEGKLVHQDHADEPTSVLLQRIHAQRANPLRSKRFEPRLEDKQEGRLIP